MNNSFSVSNPFNNETLGTYQYSSLEELKKSLDTLHNGRKTQNKLAAFERADILRKLAQLLENHKDTIAQMITREMGKTISDSHIEVTRAINTAVASSEEARQITGECIDSDAYPPARGRYGIVRWHPLGTILCITPFNFPINIAMHKIGPAFAAGNTIAFKPSPQNIESSQFLLKLCYEAGIPEDVLQLIMPDVPDMEFVITHPVISAINFTGGNFAADAIAKVSGYKKLLLEIGGNDPLIVMDDADLDGAVNAVINQRFATAGQRCTAVKRVFVHRSVYEEFVPLLLTKTAALVCGDPQEPDSFIGPLVNTRAADAVKAMIDKTIEEGGQLLLGGERIGNIITPTVLADVPSTAEIMREEVFGPVVPIQQFDDVKSIIPVINNSVYGLQAGVFTNNLDTIHYLYDELEVGALAVNDGPGFRAEHFPFGGVKESGVGREGIKYAIREMSYQKTLVL
ncbi:aldehyde dehydrogenase family protein [Vibrio sp. D420a]|uniref:sulfoacetaldehyde dehydrogenase SafD n=1 Tax=Vibrio sp. D420a TaxID=2836895 RepID=UPI002554ECC8|nr:aldehyde dehydrogenase family protein [Vibrio sp. D420a]MDK9764681.1 aldehyde dehydrogenase family protein [Vibrio sp. D420a]